ncbi:MAG TPA: TadE/TadG family type IV pilus assembly protein [Alphaproteobacteria bacterium]
MRNFIRNRDGATAIEFALLAIPYVFLTVGIIELAIMFAAASMLEGATNSAARLIRTGQIQQASNNAAAQEAAFREAFCDYATALVHCDDVVIEARLLDSFSDADEEGAEYGDDGTMESEGFEAGGSNDKVLIRAFYRYNFMTPIMGQLLGGSDSAMDFTSTIVIQTEPYEFEN